MLLHRVSVLPDESLIVALLSSLIVAVHERFEWHCTPKHGSWLNLAESELGVLTSQCLDRRMPDKRFLKSEVAACEANRNKKHTKANWRFTTESARVKLKNLYPSF